MLKRCWRLGWVALLLCGWCRSTTAREAPSPAASRFVVDHWGLEQGLPQSSVISVIQGQHGYLWLGTLYGLARFDGVHFTVFDEANTPGLNSSRIVCLFQDRRGNLWVGTQTAGIVVIGRDGSVRRLDFGRGDTQLDSACEDSRGAVWLHLNDGELARYESNKLDVLNGTFQRVVAEPSGELVLGLAWFNAQRQRVEQRLVAVTPAAGSAAFVVNWEAPVQDLNFLLASKAGGYWRFANGRIQKWKANHLVRDLGPYPWNQAATPVMAACEDAGGNLIVGTQGAGIYWFDSRGGFTHLDSGNGLSHNTILSLCMDDEGDLWAGTDGGGLNRIRPAHFAVQPQTQGLTIQSACSDRDGGVWFANFGGLLNHWAGGRLSQYGPAQGLLDLNVRSVFVDRQHRVWVGTVRGGLFELRGERFERVLGQPEPVNPSISAIYQDHQGNLWLGAQNGLARRDARGWKFFTARDGLSADDVRAIAEDAAGNLWVGTEGGGLDRWRDGKFTAFTKTNSGLPSDNVSALLPGTHGVLWIGTSGGLARYSNGQWTRYTTREGLASDGIGYLIEDGQGNLWIGSYAGLMRVSEKSLDDFAGGRGKTVRCRVFGEADGLPTRECAEGSQPAACRTPDGRLWFATIKGLVSVNPAGLKPNPFQPPVMIESVRVDGREENTNALSANRVRAIVIPPGQERLEIHYTCLNLGAADRSRFKYRLAGHESGWNEVGASRVARYSNLEPGRYTFEVTACNEDGVWNRTGASLAITVLPPFWRTWWFLSALTVALLALIVGAVHYVSTQKLQRQVVLLQHQEAMEQERARIARDLHDQLGANLTQIALLGEMAESDRELPDEVQSHAGQITQTARETTRALDEIVWAANPRNDSLEGLITYACKYAQDYLALAGIRYRLEAPPKLPEIGIPPEVRHNVFLAFKEAVNNVVRHAQASSAWIRLRVQDGFFALEIQDNGRGLKGGEENSGRNGLRNMRRRMEDVGGRFDIGPAPEGGTLVRLTVPTGAANRNHGPHRFNS